MRFVFAYWILFLWISADASANEPEYQVTLDIPFGDHSMHMLDIYAPGTVTDETPVLVFLHGGGFTRGDKTQASIFGAQFAREGIMVVSPNYRLDAAFPAFVFDAAEAVAYVHSELRTSTGDPRPLFISGWSAGAYIGAMLSYDDRYLNAQGLPPDAIAGFIGVAGPYLGGRCAGLRCPDVFPPETEANWSAADFVDTDDPPMLLVHGSRDRYVDIENLDAVMSAAASFDVPARRIIVNGGSHMGVRDDLGQPDSRVFSSVVSFMVPASAD